MAVVMPLLMLMVTMMVVVPMMMTTTTIIMTMVMLMALMKLAMMWNSGKQYNRLHKLHILMSFEINWGSLIIMWLSYIIFNKCSNEHMSPA